MKTTNYKKDDVVILNDGKRYKYLGTKLVAGIETDAYKPLDGETGFALMKDADKLWRLTPHGVDTVMNWFGLTREQAHLLIDSRLHPFLFTDAARTMAAMLAAITWVDTTAERVDLA